VIRLSVTLRSDRVLGALVASSLAAAGVHAGVAGAHFREAEAFGVFFTLTAAFQTGWPIAMVRWPSRRLAAVGAVGSAGLILLWIVSRTVGLPLGPDRWTPEAIGAADALATACEAVAVAGVVWLFSVGWRPRTVTRTAVAGSAIRAAWVLGPLSAVALIGGGHQALRHEAAPTHTAHMVLLLGACGVYALYLAMHGWVSGGYRFTWRLSPVEP
jgi:hypothetical protein